MKDSEIKMTLQEGIKYFTFLEKTMDIYGSPSCKICGTTPKNMIVLFTEILKKYD